ncbi:MAG: cytochrome c [Nonlabens sp.]
MKNWNLLIDTIMTATIITIFCLLIVGFSTYQIALQRAQIPACGTPLPAVAVCGNSFVDRKLSTTAREGERLFKSNCASCHKLYKHAVGPALYGITDKHDRKWLHQFITDSQLLISKGDTAAVHVYTEWNKQPMNSFQNLSHQEIEAILAYTKLSTLYDSGRHRVDE